MRARALPLELERHPLKAATDDAWVMRGGSAVIAPDGSYVAGPVYDDATLITADIDLAHVRREHMTLDVSGHYARPDCFDFAVSAQTR